MGQTLPAGVYGDHTSAERRLNIGERQNRTLSEYVMAKERVCRLLSTRWGDNLF